MIRSTAAVALTALAFLVVLASPTLAQAVEAVAESSDTSTIVAIGGAIVTIVSGLLYGIVATIKAGLRMAMDRFEPIARQYVGQATYDEAGRTLEKALDTVAAAIVARLAQFAGDVTIDVRHPLIADAAKAVLSRVPEAIQIRSVAEERIPELILDRVIPLITNRSSAADSLAA